MPRVQTTRTVRVALVLLRAYLILMLVLILVGFIRNRSSLGRPTHPSVGAAAAPMTRPTAPPVYPTLPAASSQPLPVRGTP